MPVLKRLLVIRRNVVAGIVDAGSLGACTAPPGSPIPATDVLINVVV
jgi:hypothetical protein